MQVARVGVVAASNEIDFARRKMKISFTQVFHAQWTLHKHSEVAKYKVFISIEGPERSFMTDVAPIIEDIKLLEGADLSSKIGKSSLEAVALHLRELVKKRLDENDRVTEIKLTENGFLSVKIGDHS